MTMSNSEMQKLAEYINALSPTELDKIREKVANQMGSLPNQVPDYAERVRALNEEASRRPGGLLGLRWAPHCVPYVTVNHGWLDFIYWDLQLPFGPHQHKTYNMQVCIAGRSPQEPFDYVAEHVKVELWDVFQQRNVRAHVRDNPEAYYSFGGNIFVVTYPRQRGNFAQYATEKLQLPV
ncbi:hypothetical protein B0H11DRAFT_1988219 [Mycena galericulata]|nr:hypothetical protein B0H11DRAFT_1988219 [Mycena galericulata]